MGGDFRFRCANRGEERSFWKVSFVLCFFALEILKNLIYIPACLWKSNFCFNLYWIIIPSESNWYSVNIAQFKSINSWNYGISQDGSLSISDLPESSILVRCVMFAVHSETNGARMFSSHRKVFRSRMYAQKNVSFLLYSRMKLNPLV